MSLLHSRIQSQSLEKLHEREQCSFASKAWIHEVTPVCMCCLSFGCVCGVYVVGLTNTYGNLLVLVRNYMVR
jgi:hypothetical protein